MPGSAARPDPYTRGDAKAMAQAGYRSLGPFPFAADYNTAGIEALLGDEPLLWIETAHFRIGCSAAPLQLRGGQDWSKDWIAGVRSELKQLQQRLPRVDVNTRELDPWLRAHLIAQRAEDIYREVQEILGVTDESFPTAPGDCPDDGERFRGLGKHLGMPQKFRLLVVRRCASHARYTRACCEREMPDPVRHQDRAQLFGYYGCAEDTANGLFANDLALHTQLAFNIAHVLYASYRSWSHDLPAWLPTGLGHWHARRVSPRFPTFDRRDDADRRLRVAFWEWDKRVQGLMEHGAFEPLAAFVTRANAGEFGLEQHMQAWSLADFLLADRQRFRRFLHRLKDPFHRLQAAPSLAELHERQNEALALAYAVDWPTLAKRWEQHVLRGKTGGSRRSLPQSPMAEPVLMRAVAPAAAEEQSR